MYSGLCIKHNLYLSFVWVVCVCIYVAVKIFHKIKRDVYQPQPDMAWREGVGVDVGCKVACKCIATNRLD